MMSFVAMVAGGTLAPPPLPGRRAHLHPADAVAMVPGESPVPPDREAQRPRHHHRLVSHR